MIEPIRTLLRVRALPLESIIFPINAAWAAGNRAEAEPSVISCTDYRALEASTSLARELGEPMATSNSGLMQVCRKRLEIEGRQIGCAGFSFSRRN